MEVVLIVVALTGIALIAVPRLSRRRARRVRRSVTPVKARRRAAAAPAPPVAVSSWSRSRAGSDADEWDDDLGWEGTDDGPREAWQRWRETESPLASASTASESGQGAAQLPSVERWRSSSGASAADEDSEWLDDDGLGWESAPSGGESRVWAAEPPARSAGGNAAAPPPQDEPADTGREWTAARNGNGNGAAPAAASSPRRFFGLHPVLLVAVYAAVGIGLVVLASTMLLGGSSAPAPASDSAPPADEPASRADEPAQRTAPAAAPRVEDSGADAEFGVTVESDDSATAAARRARRAFQRERRRALAAERRAIRAKAAEARRKRAAAERRRRARAQQPVPQSQSGGGSGGSGTGTVTPAPTPSAGGGGGGGSVQPAPPATRRSTPRRSCEFCIG